MCLNLAGGLAHVVARRTALYPPYGERQKPELALSPCPNKLTLKEKSLNDNMFAFTDEDNESSLSWEYRKFFSIMDSHAHKNESGNWEMPLPFREEKPHMPNNRAQAVNRLNGLLRTLQRNPETEKDYQALWKK